MSAALQPAQHVERILRVARFLEHGVVKHDRGVGTQDQLARHGARLVAREPANVRRGRLPRKDQLLDVGGLDQDLEAQHLEELLAAGRGRGQHKS